MVTLLQRLADDARQSLRPKRFLHVLGVTHTAVTLAIRHGVDPVRAAAAALLHDRSKETPPERIKADLESRGSAIPEDDAPYPALWHGPHAAVLARDEYGISEEDGLGEIAEAVTIHSTADAAMSPLAQILFLADYLEPSRDFEGIDELRALARQDLTGAFKRALENKCRHMRERGHAISPRARRALVYYGIEPVGGLN